MNIDYAYVVAGLTVIIIALFNRELLVEKHSFRIILAGSMVLFFAGFLIHFSRPDPRSACGALLSPLLSLGLYRLSRRLFVVRVGHEPRDTYLNWKPGLGVDRVFNIVYFGSAFFIMLITTGAMMELAKAGW